MEDTPILSALLSPSESSISVAEATPTGLHFIYSVGSFSIYPPDKLTGIYAVALPFQTTSHLLAVPKSKKDLFSSITRQLTMQPVDLEGDYNDYFSLYAKQGQQVESRYVLDPSAMEFTVDFCAEYAWEIANDTLYFESEKLLPDLQVVDDFVKQITPELAVSSGINLVKRPQVEEQLSSMASKLLCPVCNMALRSGKRWLACSSGHGYLLTSGELIETRQHMNDTARAVEESLSAQPNVITKISVVPHGDLTCPNDGQTLTKEPYQQTPGYLYSCHSCAYRWIDGQDLDFILGKYRNDSVDEPDDESNSEDTRSQINSSFNFY